MSSRHVVLPQAQSDCRLAAAAVVGGPRETIALVPVTRSRLTKVWPQDLSTGSQACLWGAGLGRSPSLGVGGPAREGIRPDRDVGPIS